MQKTVVMDDIPAARIRIGLGRLIYSLQIIRTWWFLGSFLMAIPKFEDSCAPNIILPSPMKLKCLGLSLWSPGASYARRPSWKRAIEEALALCISHVSFHL